MAAIVAPVRRGEWGATYNPAMSARRLLMLSCFAGASLLAIGWATAAEPLAPPNLLHPEGRAAVVAPPPIASASAAAASSSASGASRAASRPVAQAASTPQAVVIEDKYTRIEELHEHGEVRSIKVQPKGGRAYEIVPATGGRDLSNSAGTGRGAAGQRVWPILSF
jgi:hypothetical protein